MRDWRGLVEQRLKGIRLSERESAEVSEELSDHLQSVYETSVADGLGEQPAVERALGEVSNWQELRTKIESSRKKELPVNKRVSQFWFPALVTLFLSMVLLMVIQLVGPDPAAPDPLIAGSSHWRLIAPIAVVYVSWLLTLPFIGALGAWLSKRAGGSFKTIFSAMAFPVFPFLTFFVIGLPIALILDDHVAHNITIPAFLVGASAWIVFPAIALVSGGLPVYFLFSRSGSSQVAHS
jgi:hypothetical protein